MPERAGTTEEILGLVPAAGRARRLGATAASSKEILPLERLGRWRGPSAGDAERPLPVAAHLLRSMRRAGIDRAVVVHRHDKADLEAALGDGRALGGPRLEFLPIPDSGSVPETLGHALRRLASPPAIALGFPDVLAEPADAFVHLVALYRSARGDGREPPDLVLGLFPTDRPDKADVALFAAEKGGQGATAAGPIPGRVTGILHKPGAAAPPRAGAGAGHGRWWTWLLLVGSPAFAARLESFAREGRGPRDREPQVSDVVLEAIDAGQRAVALAFPRGSHLDIGTPEDLERARDGGGDPGVRR